MQSFKLMSLKNALVVLILLLTASCAEKDHNKSSETMESVMNDTAMEHAAKHLDPKYVCPMHPQIIRDEPGSCPICGMDLVSRLIESNDDKYPAVEVQSAVVQNMGVRTTKARIDTIWKYIRSVGRVDYDETTLTHLHPKADGWMETLLIRAEGEPVKKGEKIGEFYSPDILSAQLDYLIALQQAGPQRAQKARNRLRLLGVAETTIDQIDPNTGSVQFRALFPNPKSLLANGNSGTIMIPKKYQNALVVPEQSTFEDQTLVYAFQLTKGDTLRKIQIEIETRIDNYVLIEKGLKKGDSILGKGLNQVRQGTKIKPKMVPLDSIVGSIDKLFKG